MQTNPGRKGIAGARTQNTLFEPDFLMLYKGEKYGQQNYYNVDMEVRRTSRRCAACRRSETRAPPPRKRAFVQAEQRQVLIAPSFACRTRRR